MTPRALAHSLLAQCNEEIARGIHPLMCTVVPAYTRVDRDASQRAAAAMLRSLAGFLNDGDLERMVGAARSLVEVRRLGGLDSADIVVLTHVYLAVIRRAFFARASSVPEVFAAFEVLEDVSLPLMRRLVQMILADDKQPALGEDLEHITLNDGGFPGDE